MRIFYRNQRKKLPWILIRPRFHLKTWESIYYF